MAESEGPLQPTEPGTRQPVQRTTWPIDRTTAALFGARIAQLRSAKSVSLEGLATGQPRTAEWFTAVERGDLALTPKQLGDVGKALWDQDIVVNVDHLVADLQTHPLHATATLMRHRLNLSGWVPEATDTGPQDTKIGAVPVAPVDRVLVLGPLAVVLAVVALTAQALAWALNAKLEPEAISTTAEIALFTKDLVVSSTVLLTLLGVLAVGKVDKLLEGLAKRGRFESEETEGQSKLDDPPTEDTQVQERPSPSPTPYQCLSAIAKMTKHDGIKWKPEGWRVAELLPHVIPAHRTGVRKAAARVGFSERLAPLLMFCLVPAQLAFLASILTPGPTVYALGPGLVLTLLFALSQAAYRERDLAASICAGNLIRGLGWAPRGEAGYQYDPKEQ